MSTQNKQKRMKRFVKKQVNKDLKVALRGAPVRRRINRGKNIRIDNNRTGIIRTNIPLARGRVMRNRAPVIRNNNRGITVSHREFIQNIGGGSSSEVWNIAVNKILSPGYASVFPWLNNIATNYESYRFTKFAIHYIPTCPTTTDGNLQFVFDFDLTDEPPSTELDMLNYKGAVVTTPYNEFIHNLTSAESNKLFKNRFVTSNEFPEGELNQFAFARLMIAYSGTEIAATTVGKLFFDYTVQLQTPIAKGGITKQIAIANTIPTKLKPFLGAGSSGLNTTWYGDGYLVDIQNLNASYDSFFLRPGFYLITYGFESDYSGTPQQLFTVGTSGMQSWTNLGAAVGTQSEVTWVVVNAEVMKNRFDIQFAQDLEDGKFYTTFFEAIPIEEIAFNEYMEFASTGQYSKGWYLKPPFSSAMMRRMRSNILSYPPDVVFEGNYNECQLINDILNSHSTGKSNLTTRFSNGTPNITVNSNNNYVNKPLR